MGSEGCAAVRYNFSMQIRARLSRQLYSCVRPGSGAGGRLRIDALEYLSIEWEDSGAARSMARCLIQPAAKRPPKEPRVLHPHDDPTPSNL